MKGRWKVVLGVVRGQRRGGGGGRSPRKCGRKMEGGLGSGEGGGGGQAWGCAKLGTG